MKRDPASFVVVFGLAIATLAGLNALPCWLGGEPLGVVRYGSVEALEARHGRVWRPAALPSPWVWPPSRVRLAVGDPDWVEFVFSGTEPLTICQTLDGALRLRSGQALRPRSGHASSVSADAADVVPNRLLRAGQLLETADVTAGGRPATMRRLLLEDGAIVHELWWRNGATRIMLRLRGPAERVPAIARVLIGSGS